MVGKKLQTYLPSGEKDQQIINQIQDVNLIRSFKNHQGTVRPYPTFGKLKNPKVPFFGREYFWSFPGGYGKSPTLTC